MLVDSMNCLLEIILEPAYGINADVTLVVDTTNTDDIDASIDTFESQFIDSWIIEADPVFITSTPSEIPSVQPTKLPSTLQPSASPSITGLVVAIDVTTPVTSELSSQEISEMTTEVIDSFGVTDDDVTTEVDYIASGLIVISIGDETS